MEGRVRVLVTGAAGFIGSRLGPALRLAGHYVQGIDKARFAPLDLPTDVTDGVGGLSTVNLRRLDALLAVEAVAGAMDVIVHLGAQCSTARSLVDPLGDFVDNALGTVNVAEAARRAGGVPVVFTSTCKVTAGHDGRVAPLGMSKSTAEQYLWLYRDLYRVPSVVLRPSTVYGPGQDGTSEAGWFTWFARAALSGQRIEVAGDGSQSRDVLYIDDMVALLVDVVEHVAEYVAGLGDPRIYEQAYEVGGGPGNEVSLTGLLDELGYHNTVSVPRPPGDLQRVVTNNAAVSAVRGWVPTVGWRDGLARTLEWLKEAQR